MGPQTGLSPYMGAGLSGAPYILKNTQNINTTNTTMCNNPPSEAMWDHLFCIISTCSVLVKTTLLVPGVWCYTDAKCLQTVAMWIPTLM